MTYVDDERLCDLVYTGLIVLMGGEEQAQELIAQACDDLVPVLSRWTDPSSGRNAAMVLVIASAWVRLSAMVRSGMEQEERRPTQ